MDFSRYDITTNLFDDKLLIKFIDRLSEDIYEKSISSNDIENIDLRKFAKIIEKCKQNDPDYQIETNYVGPNQLAINVKYSNDLIDVNYPILLNKKYTNANVQNEFVSIGRIVCIEIVGQYIPVLDGERYTQESLNNIRNVTEEFIRISVQTDTIDLTIVPVDTYDATTNISKFYNFEFNSTINFNETFPNLKNVIVNNFLQLEIFCSRTYFNNGIHIYFNNNIESITINAANIRMLDKDEAPNSIIQDIYFMMIRDYTLYQARKYCKILKLPNLKILKYNLLYANNFYDIYQTIGNYQLKFIHSTSCRNLKSIHITSATNVLNKFIDTGTRQSYQQILDEIRTFCRNNNVELTLT